MFSLGTAEPAGRPGLLCAETARGDHHQDKKLGLNSNVNKQTKKAISSSLIFARRTWGGLSIQQLHNRNRGAVPVGFLKLPEERDQEPFCPTPTALPNRPLHILLFGFFKALIQVLIELQFCGLYYFWGQKNFLSISWPLVLGAYTEAGKVCIGKPATNHMREQMRRQNEW